jgi:carboxyl-terminal processing protease
MKKINKSSILITVVIGVVFVLFSFQSRFFEVAKQIEIYTTLFKELNMYYVHELNPAELTTQALKNTLKNLDPYTNYYNEQDVEAAKIRREGAYGGIGASIRYSDKETTITAISEGYAADKAGLKPGDVILKINNQVLKKLKREEISMLLLGVPKSAISLEVIRQGNRLNFDFKREKIEVNPVPFSQMINEDTGYIVLTKFNEKAASEVKKAFNNLKEKGMQKLIFDLRSNPGGLLGEAINISNFFLPKGKRIVSTKAKVKKWSNTYISRNSPLDLEIPIVVLINRRSASASEIVAGALQDYDRAVVLGERSFGKGLVQKYRPLSYGTQLKVTISKYYTPSGRCIQELDYANRDNNGIVPKFSDGEVHEFTTQNGRKVYDGGGIQPDLDIESTPITEATKALLASHAIFNYATKFVLKTPLLNIENFSFSSQNFKQFVRYLKEIDTTFVTKQERLFKTAYLATENNRFVFKEYQQIKKKLQLKKIKEISKNQRFLTTKLENEIIKRLYYDKGVYQHHLKNDKGILNAARLLKDKKKYTQLLTPKK